MFVHDICLRGLDTVLILWTIGTGYAYQHNLGWVKITLLCFIPTCGRKLVAAKA